MPILLNTSDLERGIDVLAKKFPQAIRRSLQRAAVSGRQEIVGDMSADTGLPVNKVRDAVKVVVKSDSQVNLEVQSGRIPLIDFGARGPEPSRGMGRGVTYRNPGGSRNRAPHAFIATMPSGHRGVFERIGTQHKIGPGGKRTGLPIRELMGPSLVKVFLKFMPRAEERAREALTENLRHEIDYALGGK